MKRKRIVFLMSDTGGGHRAAAVAIRTAMDMQYPGEYSFELVDVYRRYTPFPFKLMPEVYPRWINYAQASWGISFWFANARYRSRLVMAALNRFWEQGVRCFVSEHPADVIVCVHPLFSRPVIRAFHHSQPSRPPFVTVVTDLVSTHAFWYEKEVERCLVPTQAAYDRGLLFGLRPEQMRITGLPVHPQLVQDLPAKEEARRRLAWDPDLPAVLLSGGADGMGPVYAIACELNRRALKMQIAIIAGRNRLLQRRLQAIRWNQPTHIYPFINTMPELMAAADMLITKAGPATLCEACAAGLPVVISGAVPGQECGNITYIVNNGVGVYAPRAECVADTIRDWLNESPEKLALRAQHARALSQPNAAFEIAEEIHLQAHYAPICTRFRGHRMNQQPHFDPAPEDGWVI